MSIDQRVAFKIMGKNGDKPLDKITSHGMKLGTLFSDIPKSFTYFRTYPKSSNYVGVQIQVVLGTVYLLGGGHSPNSFNIENDKTKSVLPSRAQPLNHLTSTPTSKIIQVVHEFGCKNSSQWQIRLKSDKPHEALCHISYNYAQWSLSVSSLLKKTESWCRPGIFVGFYIHQQIVKCL